MSKSEMKEGKNSRKWEERIWRNVYDRIQMKNINKRKKFHNIIQGMNMHLVYMRNSEIWIVRHILRKTSSFKGFNDSSILKEKEFHYVSI